MKLKSKLIATIVSICAAIAVMGVGVWAASNSFSVTVSNNLNLSFQNLNGTVEMLKAGTIASNGVKEDINQLAADVELYDYSEGENKVKFTKVDGQAGESTTIWTGADYIQEANIAETTTTATIAYEFKYTGAGTGAAYAGVTITEDADSAIKKGVANAQIKGATVSVNYYVSTDGTAWAEATVGTTYTVADNANIHVVALLTYSNPNGASVSINNQSWIFTLAFAAQDTAGTAISGSLTRTIAESGIVTVAA